MKQGQPTGCFQQWETYGSAESAGFSTRLTSNTHRSSGSLVSFDIIASTSCVTDPVSSHSEVQFSKSVRDRVAPTIDLLQYPEFKVSSV